MQPAATVPDLRLQKLHVPVQ